MWAARRADLVYDAADQLLCVLSFGDHYEDTRLHLLSTEGTLRWSRAYSNLSRFTIRLGQVLIRTKTGQLWMLGPDGNDHRLGPSTHRTAIDPVITPDGMVYVIDTAGRPHALNPDGTPRRRWEPPPGAHDKEAHSLTIPAVAADGAIYVTGIDGYLYAITASGETWWRYALGCPANVFNAPTPSSIGVYLVGEDNCLHAIDPSGRERWRYTTAVGTWLEASPVVDAEGTVYPRSADEHLYRITQEGTVRAVPGGGDGGPDTISIGTDSAAYVAVFGDLTAYTPRSAAYSLPLPRRGISVGPIDVRAVSLSAIRWLRQTAPSMGEGGLSKVDMA